MKVALYARVSTEDKGQNPENQLDILRGIAKREGLEVYREYVDYASGKDPNRPQFQMMREAAKRREFEAIYAVRLDRIMRSVTHLNALLQEMKQYRVSLRFSDMVFDYDNPSSMLVFQVLAAIAEWERGIISARTREGLQHAKNQGKKLGRSYRDDLPIQEILSLRNEGASWNQISERYGIPVSTLRDHVKRATENVPPISQGADNGGCNSKAFVYKDPDVRQTAVSRRGSEQ